jgi:hypothetical protein
VDADGDPDSLARHFSSTAEEGAFRRMGRRSIMGKRLALLDQAMLPATS